jgi:hypothetical protein
MYQRGDRVLVTGGGDREVILRVWKDHGEGVTLSTEDGYQRLLSGDPDAPQVGFPIADIRGSVPTGAAHPTVQPQPSEQSPTAAPV